MKKAIKRFLAAIMATAVCITSIGINPTTVEAKILGFTDERVEFIREQAGWLPDDDKYYREDGDYYWSPESDYSTAFFSIDRELEQREVVKYVEIEVYEATEELTSAIVNSGDSEAAEAFDEFKPIKKFKYNAGWIWTYELGKKLQKQTKKHKIEAVLFRLRNVTNEGSVTNWRFDKGFDGNFDDTYNKFSEYYNIGTVEENMDLLNALG